MIALDGSWRRGLRLALIGAAGALALAGGAVPAGALANTPVAPSAVDDDYRIVSEFYGLRDGRPFWSTSDAFEQRGDALLRVLEDAAEHGLPPGRFAVERLKALRDDPSRPWHAEQALSLAFIDYARSVSAGLLVPRKLGNGIHIDPIRPDAATLLVSAASAESLTEMLAALPPADPGYERLRASFVRLLEDAALGGWGLPVEARLLRRGDRGQEVSILRERLVRLGDLPPEPEMTLPPQDGLPGGVFDARMEIAVKAFQLRHGLAVDGVAGPRTLAAINTPIEQRIAQVLINMERRRWRNRDLGRNRVVVNLAAFEMAMFNDDKQVFSSRVVVGQAEERLSTPEFSDMIDHLVVNPTWFLPRSIATREILPRLREDPDYLSKNAMYLTLDGTRIDPATIDWSTVTEDNFAYSIRQAPGPGNALGRVKFMFPNAFSVYLHDTPARNLFSKPERAFSHGCVRVEHPLEFAEALLSAQTLESRKYVDGLIETGQERYVTLKEPMPVHLIYETAWVDGDGTLHFRPDIYGRDEVIAAALNDART